jgi:hypothetical protein
VREAKELRELFGALREEWRLFAEEINAKVQQGKKNKDQNLNNYEKALNEASALIVGVDKSLQGINVLWNLVRRSKH